jgi:CheY-like chemotaxis protein
VDRTVPKKILIVEDEKHIIELLCAIFDGLANYRTIYARDGQEALKLARINAPDIILLDIYLPELDGYEVCRFVKSDPTMSHTKVLMISVVWRKTLTC